MPNTQSNAASQVVDLPSDLKQLATAIGELPSEHKRDIAPLLDRVIESTSRRRRILSLVQDALGQLRLDMKYLMFDLEATRRERDECQQQLERMIGDQEEEGQQ